jgi:hypothetical protein
MSIMLNIDNDRIAEKKILDLNRDFEKVNPKSRLKLKWKTIEELVRYKKHIVHYFLNNLPNLYLQFGKGWQQNWRLSPGQFHKLMVWGGFCEIEDRDLSDKFVYACDCDEKEQMSIDYRYFLVGFNGKLERF